MDQFASDSDGLAIAFGAKALRDTQGRQLVIP
jgi:hypothetical protein